MRLSNNSTLNDHEFNKIFIAELQYNIAYREVIIDMCIKI